MDRGSGIDCADGVREYDRQKALLASTTARIDKLAGGRSCKELGELLDWMAHFTREHFGFQRRLLTGCGQFQDYLLTRAAIQSEFRRKLAGLCLDMMRGDVSVPARLGALGHELLQDIQEHDAVFAQIIRSGGADRRLRRQARQGEVAADAAPDQ